MSDQPAPAPSRCSCAEHGVTGLDELLALMADGLDQPTASRMLWGPQKGPAQDPAAAGPQAGPDL